MVSRSAEKPGFFQRLGSLRAGRHLARFLKGVRRSRVLTAVIGGDSAFLPHVLWGGLSSPPSQPRTPDSIGPLDAVEV
jgi:hypothetical protein